MNVFYISYKMVLQSGVMGPPSKNPMGPPTKNLVKRPGQDCYFYIYSRWKAMFATYRDYRDCHCFYMDLLTQAEQIDSNCSLTKSRRQLSDIICQLGQLSARTTVSSDNCQLGHLSARTTVRPDNCKVSNCQNPMDNCQIKLSELWKNCQSYGKTVSSDSCPLKTVRPDSCPPRLFC